MHGQSTEYPSTSTQQAARELKMQERFHMMSTTSIDWQKYLMTIILCNMAINIMIQLLGVAGITCETVILETFWKEDEGFNLH